MIVQIVPTQSVTVIVQIVPTQSVTVIVQIVPIRSVAVKPTQLVQQQPQPEQPEQWKQLQQISCETAGRHGFIGALLLTQGVHNGKESFESR